MINYKNVQNECEIRTFFDECFFVGIIIRDAFCALFILFLLFVYLHIGGRTNGAEMYDSVEAENLFKNK